MARNYLAAVLVLCMIAGGAFVLDATLLDTPSQSENNELTGTLAPGLTATGLTEPGKLMDAHERVLETDSHTLYGTVLQHYSNGTTRRHFVWMGQRSHSSTRSLYRSHYLVTQPHYNDRPLTQLAYYHRNNQTYEAASSPTTTTYQVVNESSGEMVSKALTRHGRLPLLFSVFKRTDGVTVSQLNTTTSHPYYRVQLTKLSSPESFAVAERMETIRNASLTAVVDAWGVIHRYQLRSMGTEAGQTIHVRESMRVTAIGQTSIQQPAWYQQARNNMTS
ncbi:hypothetical protein [Haladaptatus caseinilyticus]|uniref:hypothetical protein n=1 Tax=Haladaptatus caseinilyticus TaxID=2993314 RepID=UPI00224B92EE|nr:hypothetical protein [Haladaptatus caseinilyticus]